MKKVEMSCPAKVNLLLKILGKRQDGFHELLTFMQAIDLTDSLEVWRKSGSLEFQCDDSSIPKDKSNLVVRAAQLFLKKTNNKESVGLKLVKRIPVAAGLGGGSSDAATTLLAMNKLFDHPLEQETLSGMAAQLGSDVPFFLTGGAAVCRGRGEIIAPYRHQENPYFILINPGIPLSTKEVYEHFHGEYADRDEAETLLAKIIEGFTKRDIALSSKAFSNDLEKPAFERMPLLKGLKESLLQSGGLGAMLSGSGPTVFAVAPDKLAAEQVCERARKLLRDPAGFRYFVAKAAEQ